MTLGYVVQQYDQNWKRHIIRCNEIKNPLQVFTQTFVKRKKSIKQSMSKQKSSPHSVSPQITMMTYNFEKMRLT